MAIQAPPPVPVVTQQSTAPTGPTRGGCFGRGCGCSCLGCAGVLVLATLLLLGSGYWFFVVQASAAVTAPASLIVFNQPVTVNNNPGTAGQALNANDTVETKTKGHAAIQFPDGSYVRMSPDTTVQITNVQLQRTGQLQTADVVQKVGRTLTNVQHLASGAQFKVGGHSVSAEVRGTQFELLVRANNTNLIKVFDGTVSVAGKTKAQVNAGQEVEADANGTLSAVRAIRPDPLDPYALTAQCARAVSLARPRAPCRRPLASRFRAARRRRWITTRPEAWSASLSATPGATCTSRSSTRTAWSTTTATAPHL